MDTYPSNRISLGGKLEQQMRRADHDTYPVAAKLRASASRADRPSPCQP